MGSKVRMLTILAATLLTAAAVAPGSGATAQPNPLLRVVHASPDASTLGVFVDGRELLATVAFAEATTYVSVPPGPHRIQVFPSAAGPSGPPLIDTSVDLQPGQAYTVVAVDLAAQMTPVVLSDRVVSLADDKANVRLVHASPDVPGLADVAVVNGPLLLRNLAFKSAPDYLLVDPGTYQFEVRPAGTVLALATTEPISVAADGIYTIFVVGQLGDNSLRALVVDDNAQRSGVDSMPSTGAGGTIGPRHGRQTLLLVGGLLVLMVGLRRAAVRSR